ncbi:MAG: hypothetical protein WCC14_15235 [Acidobacteriaceae bacterium]
MTRGRRNIPAGFALCALLVAATVPATGQSGTPIGGVTKSDAVWIVVGIAAVGAGVGIGVFYALHHGHSLNGCAMSGTNGLELQNRGDRQTYALIGEVAGIKPGDRVRVAGKKEKKSVADGQSFVVEKLIRDYGPCKAQPAAQ